ncbi:hypothetical protein FHQ26_00625 [Testudinibacter sp. TR-2022]|nr:hypothetical protein [Testudinibacter sp. TR-2022]TNH04037.1 hypothetical protein FHQ22_05815 [Pasteurellaceae bacterium Phil31]TNH07189.1 hypothetical protein FHQ25_11655 [Testudinibacter sp. TR-2022]TNH13039.1 hypothetical protein FHQ26_00625 [Testudinibacter sp. TR-2022]
MSDKFHKMTVTIPFSIVRVIDRIVDVRKKDGEMGVSRHSVAAEFLRLASRIKERELNQDSDGILADKSITLDEKLRFIAGTILQTQAKTDSVFSLCEMFVKPTEQIVTQILDSNAIPHEKRERLNYLFGELKK